ncbi:unnamed protein product, partial [Iphiclides podalirius]
MGWCWFHLGEYRRALDQYEQLRARDKLDSRISDNIAIDLAVPVANTAYCGIPGRKGRLGPAASNIST